MVDVTGLTEAQVLGLTGAAEARSYFEPGVGWRSAPIANMVAVMCSVVNRQKADPARFGATVTEVCLKHAQYSCWTEGSGPNHDWLMGQVAALKLPAGSPGSLAAGVVTGCIGIAQRIIDGTHTDLVNGATHYYAPVSMVPPGSVPPWAVGKSPVATVGDHLFFVGV